MTRETMHTPGPWYAYQPWTEGRPEPNRWWVRPLKDNQASHVLAECADLDDPTQNEANARFIVHACNSHDDLVAVLERLTEWAEEAERRLRSYNPGPSIDTKDPLFYEAKPLQESARDALAKARGES